MDNTHISLKDGANGGSPRFAAAFRRETFETSEPTLSNEFKSQHTLFRMDYSNMFKSQSDETANILHT